MTVHQTPFLRSGRLLLLFFPLYVTRYTVFANLERNANHEPAGKVSPQERHLRGRRLDRRELEEGTRIYAKYIGERGHQVARGCARSVLKDDTNNGEILLLGNGFCMYELLKDPQVAQVDFDYQVFELTDEDNHNQYGSLQDENLNSETRKSAVNAGFSSYGAAIIQANRAPVGPNDITICIADTGIAMSHPGLDSTNIDGTDAEEKFLPGDDATWKWNFDTNGHGTHIAGTIQHILKQAGRNQNGAKAGKIKIHITRALSREGRSYEYDVRLAVKQCVMAGANIINLSLGSSFSSPNQSEFLEKVIESKSVLVIAGAGNDGDSGEVWPAFHPSVISVGAVDSSGSKIAASNSNSQVELAAPGDRIVSTDVSTYPATMVQLEGNVVSGRLLKCTVGDTLPDCSGAICWLRQQSGDILDDLLVKCMRAGGVGAIVSGSNSRRLLENTEQREEVARQEQEEAGAENPVLGVVEGVLGAEGDGTEESVATEKPTDPATEKPTDPVTEKPTDAVTENPTDAVTEKPTDAEDEIYDPRSIPVAKVSSLSGIEASLGEEVTIGDHYVVKHIFAERTGTSMATPHVTAAAAILWSHHPNCAPQQIRYALANTAQHPIVRREHVCDSNYGYGVIQIKDALDWLNQNDCTRWEVPHRTAGGCTTL